MIDTDNKKGQIIIALFILLMVSVIYSKFLLSVSMILLTIMAWLHIEGDQISIMPDAKDKFVKAIKSPIVIGFFLVFFATFISGINSDNTSEWLHHVKMRTPFLFLPVTFLMLPKLNRQWYHKIHYIFIGLMVVSSLPVLIHYISNSDTLHKLIGVGKTIPTPINHIKYSLLLALAIVSLLVLYFRKFTWKYDWERYIQLAVTFYLFLLIHILAVRSGIAVLYICLMILGIRYIIQSKDYLRGLMAMLALVAFPLVAYYTLPSFKQKIHYMLYDLEMYSKGKGANYSDSERLRSYQIGVQLWKESPVLGTGIGDLYAECKRGFETTFADAKITLYPHNQFLFILAGMGLLGLTLFIFGFTLPLIYRYNYREALFLCLYITLLSSFMVENTLERSYSTGFFVFFLLLGIKYLNEEVEVKTEMDNR